MRSSRLFLFTLLMAPQFLTGAELKLETVRAFDGYIRQAETRIGERARDERNFLWLDDSPERLTKARAGEVVVGNPGERNMTAVKGGLIHDWIGGTFVPGASLAQAAALVQDYDNHERFYDPEVAESRLLRRDGNDFHIYYRLLKKKVITVVLSTEHEVRYFPVDETRMHSRSHTTRISEVKNAGTPDESELADGRGGGYLWRLYSYWRFVERDGGVYVELRAISLTRGIPTGLGWLVKPVIRDMPHISITHTLSSTRDALVKREKAAD